MIIVKVELWSAVTGRVQEIARMEICNEGTHMNPRRGNYIIRTLRGRDAEALGRRTTQKETTIENWPRLALHVWNLVAVSLRNMGYGDAK